MFSSSFFLRIPSRTAQHVGAAPDPSASHLRRSSHPPTKSPTSSAPTSTELGGLLPSTTDNRSLRLLLSVVECRSPNSFDSRAIMAPIGKQRGRFGEKVFALRDLRMGPRMDEVSTSENRKRWCGPLAAWFWKSFSTYLGNRWNKAKPKNTINSC